MVCVFVCVSACLVFAKTKTQIDLWDRYKKVQGREVDEQDRYTDKQIATRSEISTPSFTSQVAISVQSTLSILCPCPPHMRKGNASAPSTASAPSE